MSEQEPIEYCHRTFEYVEEEGWWSPDDSPIKAVSVCFKMPVALAERVETDPDSTWIKNRYFLSERLQKEGAVIDSFVEPESGVVQPAIQTISRDKSGNILWQQAEFYRNGQKYREVFKNHSYETVTHFQNGKKNGPERVYIKGEDGRFFHIENFYCDGKLHRKQIYKSYDKEGKLSIFKEQWLEHGVLTGNYLRLQYETDGSVRERMIILYSKGTPVGTRKNFFCNKQGSFYQTTIIYQDGAEAEHTVTLGSKTLGELATYSAAYQDGKIVPESERLECADLQKLKAFFADDLAMAADEPGLTPFRQLEMVHYNDIVRLVLLDAGKIYPPKDQGRSGR